MPNNILIFKNNEFGTIRVMETEDDIWFVGKEVTAILGYNNGRDAVRKYVDRKDKTTAAIHDGRQNRYYSVINEGGLYDLILSSKLPSAKRFRKWIISDVLLSIKKHGDYTTEELLEKLNMLTAVTEKLKEERDKINKQEEEDNVKIWPQPEPLDAAIGNTMNAILIRDYAKILASAKIKIGQDKLFKWFHSKGYIYRDRTTDQWLAYKKYIDMGLFLVSQSRVKIPNFGDKLSFTIKITGIGQKYFYEELRSEYV